MKPITPAECKEQMGSDIPEIVIEAVNNLLRKNYRKSGVTLKQDEIIDEIRRLDDSVSRNSIFEKRWLDFEPIFERAGWSVTFDKPGYNETYAANFRFKPIE